MVYLRKCSRQFVRSTRRRRFSSSCRRRSEHARDLDVVTADAPRALRFSLAACDKGVAKAGLVAAVMHEGGIGTKVDEAAATALLTRACELGDDNGCKASKARAPKKPAALVVDANVTVESLAADGLELRELACAMESMPLFGTVVIAGTLAKQKRYSIDGEWMYNMPGDHGRAVRIVWRDQRGRRCITNLGTPNPEPAVAAIEQAMRALPPGAARDPALKPGVDDGSHSQ